MMTSTPTPNKTLIYQVSLGLPNKSNPLYEWCNESVRKYAMRIGSDHIIQTEPILRINPDWKHTNRSKESCGRFGCLPIFEKENAFDLLGTDDGYDMILILDSDVYVKPDAPSIFDEINCCDNRKSMTSFGGVLESHMPITEQYRKKILSYSRGQYATIADDNWVYNPKTTGYDFWNMGVMLLNKPFKDHLNGMDAKTFLSQDKFKDFIDGKGNWKWSTDQTLLNWWIRKEQMKTVNLDWKWNALYKGVRDEMLKEAHFVHFFLSVHHVKNNDFKSLEKEMGIIIT